MPPAEKRITDDPMRVALERRAMGLNDGSQDLERDKRADATAAERGITESYEKAVADGRIIILSPDKG